jgi:hypothetical protein
MTPNGHLLRPLIPQTSVSLAQALEIGDRTKRTARDRMAIALSSYMCM